MPEATVVSDPPERDPDPAPAGTTGSGASASAPTVAPAETGAPGAEDGDEGSEPGPRADGDEPRPGDDDGSPLEVADGDDEASYPAPLRHTAGRYAKLLLIPLALGLALRIGLALGDKVITNDASTYLESGRNLVDGRGYVRDGNFPELHFPPGAPVFLGLVWKLTGSPLFALASINLVSGFLALFPLAALGRRLGGDRAGLAACWVGALAPGITSIPSNAGGGSESMYLLFLLTCLWLVSTLPTRKGIGVWATAVVAGLAAGALYLTRPEGLLLVLVIVASTALSSGVIRDLRGRELSVRGLVRQLGPPTVLFVVFLACMAPYLAFLHTHTGKWEFTAKSQDANIEAWRAVAGGDRRARDVQLYELDDTGLRFVHRSESLTTLARRDPSGYAGIVGTNLNELRAQYVDPQVASPTPFPKWALLPLPLTVLALWTAWRGRRKRADLVLVGIVALATATCLGFFVQARYLIPAAGVLCILAGVGLVQVRPNWRKWAFYGAVVLLAVPVIVDVPRHGGIFDTREPVEHRIAGEWLADNAPAGARIMTRSLVTEFYSARKAVAMPYGSINETVKFAYYHGVEYIVIDEFLMARFRPQLMPLLEDGPWRGLRLEHEFRYEGRLTRIFSLDPPPPVDSDNPPGLGFVGDG